MLILNPFDVLIGFILLGGVALGFVRGLVRTAMDLGVLYIAAVLAMTFYVTVGRWIGFLFGLPPSINEALAFALILILVSTLINFGLRRTYKDTELPGVRQIDQLGGMVLGFSLTSFWIGLGIVALAFFLGTPITGAEDPRQNILGYFHSSHLIPLFYKFLSLALLALKPWMPKGLPPKIFTFRP